VTPAPLTDGVGGTVLQRPVTYFVEPADDTGFDVVMNDQGRCSVVGWASSQAVAERKADRLRRAEGRT